MIHLSDYTNEEDISGKGVYIITHSSTNIKYIGSTFSHEGFRGRWRSHLNGLLRGNGNRVLLNIYHKYGIKGFQFNILE